MHSTFAYVYIQTIQIYIFPAVGIAINLIVTPPIIRIPY